MRKYLLVLISLGFVFLTGCSGPGNAPGKGKKTKTARLKVCDLRDVATHIGLLEPKNQVLLKSEVSGIVTKIHVEEGAELKKGAPILVIDPRPYQNRKEKLLITKQKCQLELNIIKREYDKNVVLQNEGAVSERELSDQKDRLDLKMLELKEINIDIKDINEKLGKAKLTSPISGTLISLDIEEGEIVTSATTGFSAGTVVGKIADTDSMEVLCTVSEVDFHALSKETKATVYLETDPSVRSEARISFISKAAKEQKGKMVRSFEVKVDVLNIHSRMVPGLNVNVEFVILEKLQVKALPAHFINKSPGKGGMEYFVFVQKQGSGPEKRAVTIGATDYKFTEILTGLEDNETVVKKM